MHFEKRCHIYSQITRNAIDRNNYGTADGDHLYLTPQRERLESCVLDCNSKCLVESVLWSYVFLHGNINYRMPDRCICPISLPSYHASSLTIQP